MHELMYSCCLIRCSSPNRTLFALPLKTDLITCWFTLNFTFTSLWTQFGCSGGNNTKELLYLEKLNLGSSVRSNPWRLRESPVLLIGSKNRTTATSRINKGSAKCHRNATPHIKNLNMANKRNIFGYKIHLRYQMEIDFMRFPSLPSLNEYLFVGVLLGELVPTTEKLRVKKNFRRKWKRTISPRKTLAHVSPPVRGVDHTLCNAQRYRSRIAQFSLYVC